MHDSLCGKLWNGNRLVAFECEVRQSKFVMLDLPITCISSANQQHVQLIIVVVSTVKVPELNLSKRNDRFWEREV